MRLPLLENVISFLLGVLWTLLGVSVLFTFLSLWNTSILLAISMSVFVASFWLFLIVLLEMANIQIDKLKELKKQTALLQKLHDQLSHH